jgi:hypothetical protein
MINHWKHNQLVRNDEQMLELLRHLTQTISLTSSAPIEVVKNGDAYHISWSRQEDKFVRITGHAEGTGYSGSSGGTPFLPENHYTGIEQTMAVGEEVSRDLISGLRFTNVYPLIEINGITSVPVDAVIRAYPALSGTHYEFDFLEGSSETMTDDHPVGCGCCCCCVPCDGDVVLTFPQTTIHRCLDESENFTIPEWQVILELGSSTDLCWRMCPEASVQIDEPGGAIVRFELDPDDNTHGVMICCDPDEDRRCPVLRLRGLIVVSSGGSNELPVGSYPVCVGPIDMSVLGCNQKNPDDPYPPGGSAVAWSATINADDLNNCDQGNWGCGCYLLFEADIEAECECEGLCPRTGLPDEFTVTIRSTYEPLDGATGTMTLVEDWPATIDPQFVTIECGAFWLATGTLSTGCRWFVAWHCDIGAGLPQAAIIPPLGGSTSSPCFIEALAWFAIHQDFSTPPAAPEVLECNPLCVQWIWGGGGVVCFEGLNSSCPECDGPFPPEPEPPGGPGGGGGGGEALYLNPVVAFEDEAGEDYAESESADEVVYVQLLVEPDDDPQSPAFRHASGSTNVPALYVDDDNRRWIGAGTSIRLALSSSLSVDVENDDMTIAVVVDRTTSTALVPLGGSGANDPGIWVDASNNVQVKTDDGSTVSTAYTGNNGPALMIWTFESGDAWFQASGMDKISLGAITGTLTLTDLLARVDAPTWTDGANYLGPIVVLEGLYTAGDFTDLFEQDGWTDYNYGVFVGPYVPAPASLTLTTFVPTVTSTG